MDTGDFAVAIKGGDEDDLESENEEPVVEPQPAVSAKELAPSSAEAEVESQTGTILTVTELFEPQPFEETEDETVDRENLRLPNQFSSGYYLNKHTPSFKCLEQYLPSTSDLKITLNFFPPPVDPGIDAAFDYVVPEPPVDVVGAEKYKNMCNDLEIVPISRIIKTLPSDTLNLKYYGLTLNQMKGIADALKVNTDVRVCTFEDNWMSPDAAALIGDIISENMAIRILNLRECRLGEEGAERLSEGLASTQFLEELDLSYNSLGDQGLKYLQPSLIENTSIKKLNLSHNDLTEASGETFEKILIENKSITDLDLSWNGFYTGPGNKKLCNGLTKNEFITRLNLSWNGICVGPSMTPISKYVKKSETLEYLDLSWNRIMDRSFRLIKAAVNKAPALVHVKLGNNILKPEDAYDIATMLANNKNNLKIVDLENITVNKDFLQVAQRIKRMGKKIIYGRVLGNYQIHGPDQRKLLFARCKFLAMKPKKKKQKKDFGHFVLSLPENPVSKDEFAVLLKKKKVKKIDKDLLQELMLKFPAKRKKIECEEMKNSYMTYYPDTVLPPPPPKKKKKGKKGKKAKKAQSTEVVKSEEVATEQPKANEQIDENVPFEKPENVENAVPENITNEEANPKPENVDNAVPENITNEEAKPES